MNINLTMIGQSIAFGIFVWFACARWPWPLQFRLGFYTLQIALAILYGVAWTAAIVALETLRGSSLASEAKPAALFRSTA